jgi:Mor family transcriptional regulator
MNSVDYYLIRGITMVVDVTKELTDIDILKNVVGNELFEKIQDQFGGSSIYIPKKSILQYDSIFDDFDNGLDLKQIARKYNYTVVWVQKLYNSYLKEKYPLSNNLKQKELF